MNLLVINPKSFILIKNEKDMAKKIEYIKKIDNDDKLYKSILKEDLFMKDIIIFFIIYFIYNN